MMIASVMYVTNFCCIAASSDQRQDAHPLPGECGQSAAVPARPARPPGEHGIARHRRRQLASDSRSHLDHHSPLPGLCSIHFT